jgi:hypothetical protein
VLDLRRDLHGPSPLLAGEGHVGAVLPMQPDGIHLRNRKPFLEPREIVRKDAPAGVMGGSGKAERPPNTPAPSVLDRYLDLDLRVDGDYGRLLSRSSVRRMACAQ